MLRWTCRECCARVRLLAPFCVALLSGSCALFVALVLPLLSEIARALRLSAHRGMRCACSRTANEHSSTFSRARDSLPDCARACACTKCSAPARCSSAVHEVCNVRGIVRFGESFCLIDESLQHFCNERETIAGPQHRTYTRNFDRRETRNASKQKSMNASRTPVATPSGLTAGSGSRRWNLPCSKPHKANMSCCAQEKRVRTVGPTLPSISSMRLRSCSP